jgi:hypothetical protein
MHATVDSRDNTQAPRSSPRAQSPEAHPSPSSCVYQGLVLEHAFAATLAAVPAPAAAPHAGDAKHGSEGRMLAGVPERGTSSRESEAALKVSSYSESCVRIDAGGGKRIEARAER